MSALCTTCNGSGRIQPPDEQVACSVCNGDGMTLIALHDAKAYEPVECESAQCPECDGRGTVRPSDLCQTCRGNGCSCGTGEWCGSCIPF